MLPLLRNPQFTKPEPTFHNILHTLFRTTHDASTVPFQGHAPQLNSQKWLFLSGEGGVGKTEIAREVCYWSKENRSDCSIFWLNARSVISLLQGCEDMLRSVGRLEAAVDEAHIIPMIQTYLSDESASGEWLLVLNDAGFDASEIFLNHLPANDNGKVLITTRLWIPTLPEDKFTIINVESLSLPEARVLLERICGHPKCSDQEQVDKLLHRLKRLPLAIVRAGAYISKTNITLPEFLKRLELGGGFRHFQ
ncbi:FxSxx-COOH system tetratricopeptide repeat protein [Microdochium nivale]|nr:FxSxx-COOH system tetratricopeptide repeat protein [Microdochium nivale]